MNYSKVPLIPVIPHLLLTTTDEVRVLGRLLKIPAHLVQRHPFPGPGLAIRILGPVTSSQVKILQQADSIYIEEIRKAGLYNEISQAFAVLLPVQAVGVMGDKRTYEQASPYSLHSRTHDTNSHDDLQVIALRAVQSEDFMTADWYVFPTEVLRKISSRITNEVDGINRVVYDISSKPPAASHSLSHSLRISLTLISIDCRMALETLSLRSRPQLQNRPEPRIQNLCTKSSPPKK